MSSSVTWNPVRSFGAGSLDFGVVFEQSEADRLLKSLLEELDPFWLSRTDPSVAFRIYGKELGVLRDKAIHGDISVDGIAPCYRYGSRELAVVNRWTPTLEYLRDVIEEKTGIRTNHCVSNQYRTGKDSIGFHGDKAKDFIPDYSVITVSLGDTRNLQVRDRKTKSGPADATITMKHGSVYLLNRATNEAYKHAVLKEKGVGLRLGLTFRTIGTRLDTRTGQVIEMSKGEKANKRVKRS